MRRSPEPLPARGAERASGHATASKDMAILVVIFLNKCARVDMSGRYSLSKVSSMNGPIAHFMLSLQEAAQKNSQEGSDRELGLFAEQRVTAICDIKKP